MFSVLLVMHATVVGQSTSPEIRSYKAPGDLEPNYSLACITLENAKAEYNPVALLKSSEDCIKRQRYADAVALIAFASAYARYDTRRVADRTAYDALSIARMAMFSEIPEADRPKLDAAFARLTSDGAEKSQFCADVKRIGPPTYFPRYMIQHGMGAFLGQSRDGLIENFESSKAWADVLSTYLHCPSS